MDYYDVVKTVRMTEKGATQSHRFNQYTIVADRHANKIQIRQAVEYLFDVRVRKVKTMNVRGKKRRQFTLAAGKDSDWKKAIVTLKEGDSISLA